MKKLIAVLSAALLLLSGGIGEREAFAAELGASGAVSFRQFAQLPEGTAVQSPLQNSVLAQQNAAQAAQAQQAALAQQILKQQQEAAQQAALAQQQAAAQQAALAQQNALAQQAAVNQQNAANRQTAQQSTTAQNQQAGTANPAQSTAAAQNTAAQEAVTDSGTYIDVNKTTQTLSLYSDGQIKFVTPIVTGNVSAGHTTPSGVYSVYAKQTNRTLKGANYSSFVKYWMPFYKSYGIHDANWRSSGEFGGTTYQTSGSHGCVNIPPENMPALFAAVGVGTPVIVHD